MRIKDIILKIFGKNFPKFATLTDFVANCKDTAFLLIDMQTSFVQMLEPQIQESLIKHQSDVLHLCFQFHRPIFQIEFKNEGKTLPELQSRIDNIKENRFYFEKDRAGLFEDKQIFSTLMYRLKETNIRCLFLMGIFANACILQTALGALKLGFNIATSPLVISSGFSEQKTASMQDYKVLKFYRDNGIFIEAQT